MPRFQAFYRQNKGCNYQRCQPSDAEYDGKRPLVVGILKGSIIFYADFIRFICPRKLCKRIRAVCRARPLIRRKRQPSYVRNPKKMAILHKPESYLMVGIVDNYSLYFAGKMLENGASIKTFKSFLLFIAYITDN